MSDSDYDLPGRDFDAKHTSAGKADAMQRRVLKKADAILQKLKDAIALEQLLKPRIGKDDQ